MIARISSYGWCSNFYPLHSKPGSHKQSLWCLRPGAAVAPLLVPILKHQCHECIFLAAAELKWWAQWPSTFSVSRSSHAVALPNERVDLLWSVRDMVEPCLQNELWADDSRKPRPPTPEFLSMNWELATPSRPLLFPDLILCPLRIPNCLKNSIAIGIFHTSSASVSNWLPSIAQTSATTSPNAAQMNLTTRFYRQKNQTDLPSWTRQHQIYQSLENCPGIWQPERQYLEFVRSTFGNKCCLLWRLIVQG